MGDHQRTVDCAQCKILVLLETGIRILSTCNLQCVAVFCLCFRLPSFVAGPSFPRPSLSPPSSHNLYLSHLLVSPFLAEHPLAVTVTNRCQHYFRSVLVFTFYSTPFQFPTSNFCSHCLASLCFQGFARTTPDAIARLSSLNKDNSSFKTPRVIHSHLPLFHHTLFSSPMRFKSSTRRTILYLSTLTDPFFI